MVDRVITNRENIWNKFDFFKDIINGFEIKLSAVDS